MSSGSSSSSSSSGCSSSSKPTNKKSNTNHSRKRNYSLSTASPYKNSVVSTPSLTDQSSSSSSNTSDTFYTLNHTLDDEPNSKNNKKRRSQQRLVPEVYTTTTHRQIIPDQTTTSTIMSIPIKAPSQRNVPAFLHKLFNMVEDPATAQLIRWSKSGNSFLVEGHEEFAKTVLPRFYKHNTFASFVRQLNMYDFHKIPHIQQGVLVTANPENEVWEFSNPNFQRDRPDLLVLVTRKRNRDRDDTPDGNGGVNLNSLVKEITAIKQHQSNITADLQNLHRDNEIIWKEAIVAREKHEKHQQVISKILQFLTAAFSNEQHQLEGVCEDMLLGQQFESQNHPFDQLQGITQEMQASHLDSNHHHDESDTHNAAQNSLEEVDPLECVEGKLDVNPPCAAMTLDVINPTHHFGLDTSKNKGKMRFDASRSAEAITHNIDELQGNVKTLATHLGIDSAEFPLDEEINHHFATTSYSSMISSATENDKSRLFELAGNKRSSLIHYNTTTESSSTTRLQYPTLQHQRQEFYSPYSHNVYNNKNNNNFLPSYPPPNVCARDTNIIAEVNVNKNTTYQSNSIPHVTNNNETTIKEKAKDKQNILTNIEARRLFLTSIMANQQLQEQKYANVQQYPTLPNLVSTQSYPIHHLSTFQQQEQTNDNNDLHHSFNNVHQLEHHIILMNSTNNNNGDADYTQQIAEASHFMNQNQNESKKEDGAIVY